MLHSCLVQFVTIKPIANITELLLVKDVKDFLKERFKKAKDLSAKLKATAKFTKDFEIIVKPVVLKSVFMWEWNLNWFAKEYTQDEGDVFRVDFKYTYYNWHFFSLKTRF